MWIIKQVVVEVVLSREVPSLCDDGEAKNDMHTNLSRSSGL